jgi:hypothetical protein
VLRQDKVNNSALYYHRAGLAQSPILGVCDFSKGNGVRQRGTSLRESVDAARQAPGPPALCARVCATCSLKRPHTWHNTPCVSRGKSSMSQLIRKE